MDTVDVVAVVGACCPERARHARHLAAATRRALLAAADIADREDIASAVAKVRWHRHVAGTVVELPVDVDVIELIGAAASAHADTALIGIVCIVDAAHLLDDLDRDDYVSAFGAHAHEMTAAALLIARQIEYASAVVIINWTTLPTDRLSTLMALVSHLAPAAQLTLRGAGLVPAPFESALAEEQDRPGWVRIINGEFDPGMTDARIGTLYYEHLRPLHPARTERLLNTIESGRFGKVVRSAGFCRLATRSHTVAQWDHVGHMMALTPLAVDGHIGEDEEMLSFGQELAFIGLDLDVDGLRAELDDAALTDAEFAAGPYTWARFADPFPPWPVASEHAD
ncbi:GTP-binding protein [Mycolicibacterium neoaurum]|uniref:GTP-binding protein n=1 Tax=Mycolicibacterium neoaurum TaxID=1795 RepID=UPI0026715CF2|nr:GTP-binding protein [Mycolicibacterium neoaurum]MDO3399908.1 GTP-binding protein [Mycolicibacterium neoaurum]